MTKTYYPELDETLYTRVLENGLTVAVVPRKGFMVGCHLWGGTESDMTEAT